MLNDFISSGSGCCGSFHCPACPVVTLQPGGTTLPKERDRISDTHRNASKAGPGADEDSEDVTCHAPGRFFYSKEQQDGFS